MILATCGVCSACVYIYIYILKYTHTLGSVNMFTLYFVRLEDCVESQLRLLWHISSFQGHHGQESDEEGRQGGCRSQEGDEGKESISVSGRVI